MPAVNYDLMLQEMLTKTPGKVNQVIYWSRRSTGRTRRSRPTPTRSTSWRSSTPRTGPIVLEMPPGDADGSINGNIVDRLADAAGGRGPAGADEGKGGKYPGPAAGLHGQAARRLHRAAVAIPSAATRCCART